MRVFVFYWDIENIKYSPHQTGRPIISPEFTAIAMLKTSWVLELYPRGIDNCDFLSLRLCRVTDGGPQSLSFNIEFSCMSADAVVLHSCFIPDNFTYFINNGHSGYAEECFIQRHEVFGRKKALYLAHDTLKLCCRMWLDDGIGNEFGQSTAITRLVLHQIVLKEVIEFEYLTEKTFTIQMRRNNNKPVMVISLMPYDKVIDVRIIPVTEEMMKYTTCKVTLVDEKTGKKVCERKTYFVGCLKKIEWRLPFADNAAYTERKKYEFVTRIVYSTGEEKQVKNEVTPTKIPKFLKKYVISYVPSGQFKDFPSSSKDLWKLYAEQVLCDVELRTRNKSFFAHQFVLCSRSSVFLTMLTQEMKEKSDRCIEIEDISVEALEEFLKFLYTNSFTDFRWNVLMELYYAADKYNMKGLNLLCCSHLLKDVNVKNVYELLFMAERHQDLELKRKVNYFIWKNEEKVFSSSKWKNLTREEPQLAMETMLSKYAEKADQSLTGTYEEWLGSSPKIQDEFRNFYERRIGIDIFIKTAGKEFPAHKTVLCASSFTIKKMITSDLSDKPINSIEMKNLDDDIGSRMLSFLYTDSLEDAKWDTVVELYKASNVYQMHRLNFKCSCFLLENLTLSNVRNLLLLAYDYDDVKLKSSVGYYVFQYHEEVFGSDDWYNFAKTNHVLALEIMQAKYRKKKLNWSTECCETYVKFAERLQTKPS